MLGALPQDQAELILLRVVGGLDTARVEAMVHKRPGTVRMLQHRGLRHLAEQLRSRGQCDDALHLTR